ncbi:hypothetical protein [Lysinibacillus xylanilyticus]|uniref:hypothetical protein n=1 Tax=Lysinibacillus xylanilyticus TaxID=582475 RepID=UPI003D03E916
MEKFKFIGHVVMVDAEKTKELYESLPLVSDKEHCGCDDCSFYAEAIVHTSPAIQVFSAIRSRPEKRKRNLESC